MPDAALQGARDTACPLPTPPDDEERDAYFRRRLRPLLALSLIGFALTVVSAARFAETHATWYWLVIAAAVFYVLVSLAVNAFTHDECRRRHEERVAAYRPARWPSVDVLLPVCGEPIEVLENTWRHVGALRWPGRLRVHVLDDGDGAAAGALARRMGFSHLARPDRGWMKKAGNLRHGFARTDGEFLVIFDADFCPREDFLLQLMPYMEDDVGIVQSPQFFRTDRRQGWLERGAGAVQEFFYRVVQTSREQRGGAICVGSNAVYRRRALEANGGTTLIEHSEDVHTGFDVRRHGWRVRYVPVNLATGLCPDRIEAFFRQQYRWCMGSMSLLGSAKFWRTRMPVLTRACYVSGFCYYAFTAAATLLFPLVPVLLLGAYPEAVRLSNYGLLLPGLVYGLVVFPLWHRAAYGLEAWSVKLVYGWAHLFALADLARRRPMGWRATGGRGVRERRIRVFLTLLVLWSGGSAAAWCGLALTRMTGGERPADFAPALLLGLFYLATVGRALTPAAPQAAVRGRRVRLALTAGAVFLLLAMPALARAAPLPAGRIFGVTAPSAQYPAWRAALGPAEARMTFQSWSAGTDPVALLRADRRRGTMPVITWEPWRPPPLGTADQGAAQPRYANARIAAGRFDALLRRWARAIRRHPGPVAIRFAHEMQGSWYPWSIDPAAYRAAWRHVRRVVRAAGARNTVWIWSPNANVDHTDARALADMEPYWPGARYVDAVGITALTFDGRARPAAFLARLRAISRRFGKPGLLTEVNVEFRAREAWLRELDAGLRADPAVRGVIWSQAPSRGARRHATRARMDWSGARDPVAAPLLRRINRLLGPPAR